MLDGARVATVEGVAGISIRLEALMIGSKGGPDVFSAHFEDDDHEGSHQKS